MCGKLPANFSVNPSANFPANFSPPPPSSRPKFTPKIVGIPLQFHIFEPNVFSRRFSAYSGKREAHKLKRILGTPAGGPWDTRRDKQGSTGQCPRNVLLFATEKQAILPGHRPGRPGGFQKIYVIFSYVPLLLPTYGGRSRSRRALAPPTYKCSVDATSASVPATATRMAIATQE